MDTLIIHACSDQCGLHLARHIISIPDQSKTIIVIDKEQRSTDSLIKVIQRAQPFELPQINMVLTIQEPPKEPFGPKHLFTRLTENVKERIYPGFKRVLRHYNGHKIRKRL